MSVETKTTKEIIIEAALAVITREGMGSMTMDNVAREAGLSKGGLFHHFPSKNDLLSGILQWIGGRAFAALQKRTMADGRPGARIRALLAISFSEVEPRPQGITQEESELLVVLNRQFIGSILTAAMESPTLLQPIRELKQQLGNQLLSEPNGREQLTIWLAHEGLMFWRVMGLMNTDHPIYVAAVHELRMKAEALADVQEVSNK